jgi:GNAT superfamily N-acetyltransferase
MTGIQVRTELRYHSNMQIKIASVTDAEAIASLAQDLARYHISQDFSLEGRQNLDDALSADAMRRYMSEGCRFHVAVADDVLQGIVAMRENRHLLLLFVAEEAQGRGLARLLWETAESAARAAGYDGVLTVSAAQDAMAMYEKFGFRASGEETDEHGIIRTLMLKPAAQS